MLRRVTLAFRLPALGLLAAACAAACNASSTTTTFTPITGIEIRSGELVGPLGCGTGDEVFRYAAVVTYAPDAGVVSDAGAPTWTNIFDCFADGVFENLPGSPTGSVTFDIAIYAWTQSAYDAVGLPASLGCPEGTSPSICTPSTTGLTATQTAGAVWMAQCTATQQSGAPVFAVCPPLEPTGVLPAEAGPADAAAGPDATVAPDAAPDGTAPDAALPEAGPDAEAAPDAGPDAPPDGDVMDALGD